MRIRSTQFFAGGAPLIMALVDYAAPNSLVVNLSAEGKQWAGRVYKKGSYPLLSVLLLLVITFHRIKSPLIATEYLGLCLAEAHYAIRSIAA